jgi:serralysin
MKNMIILLSLLLTCSSWAGKKEEEAFYKKFKKTDIGVLIKGSSLIKDEGPEAAAKIIIEMVSKREDIVKNLIKEKAEIAIFSHDENFCSIPEVKGRVKFKASADRNYCDLCGAFYETLNPPILLLCEDNLLKTKFDPYNGKESVLIHEFAHMIHGLGLTSAEKKAVNKIYKSAKAKGIYTKNDKGGDTYMMSNQYEFYAVMTEVWFESHNPKNPSMSQELISRESIKEKLPEMYELLKNIYPEISILP